MLHRLTVDNSPYWFNPHFFQGVRIEDKTVSIEFTTGVENHLEASDEAEAQMIYDLILDKMKKAV